MNNAVSRPRLGITMSNGEIEWYRIIGVEAGATESAGH